MRADLRRRHGWALHRRPGHLDERDLYSSPVESVRNRGPSGTDPDGRLLPDQPTSQPRLAPDAAYGYPLPSPQHPSWADRRLDFRLVDSWHDVDPASVQVTNLTASPPVTVTAYYAADQLRNQGDSGMDGGHGADARARAQPGPHYGQRLLGRVNERDPDRDRAGARGPGPDRLTRRRLLLPSRTRIQLDGTTSVGRRRSRRGGCSSTVTRERRSRSSRAAASPPR